MLSGQYELLTLFLLKSLGPLNVGLAQVAAEVTLKALVAVISRVC